MKKLTAILSALMLILAITPAAFATVYSEGYFKYTIADESITITEYFGKEETVTVPAMIAGIPVNTIASGAFSGSGIRELNLPDTITDIESGAIDAGVVINYNSNLPSGGQTQPSPNPPAQDNPQPNPPQPNLPGIVVNTVPPAPQNNSADGEAADDITVTDETAPEDVTVTEPAAEDKSQPEQPGQTKAESTKPAQSDDSKLQTNQAEQPEETTVTTTAQNAIEEVEIDLDTIITEEAVTTVTEESPDSTEAEETQATPAAVPEPAESDSPKPIAAIVVAAVVIAALALGGIIFWKKKK